jgi:hypothetical protein
VSGKQAGRYLTLTLTSHHITVISNIGYVLGGLFFGLFIYVARQQNKTEVYVCSL